MVYLEIINGGIVMVVIVVPKDTVGVAMDVDSNFSIDSDMHIVFHIYGNTFHCVGRENKTTFAGELEST